MAESLNGNATAEELNIHPVKITVVGDAGCGKTTFINSFYRAALQEGRYSEDSFMVSQCSFPFNNVMRNLKIVEIGSNNFDALTMERLQHSLDTDIFILMFALDDFETFNNLSQTWFPEVAPAVIGNSCPVAFLANKNDLENAMEDPIPFNSIYEHYDIQNFRTIERRLSSINVGDVLHTFINIFQTADIPADQ